MSDITTDPRPWPTVDGRELTPDEVRASEDCEHEWSGPLDKHPTCLHCDLPYEGGDKTEAPPTSGKRVRAATCPVCGGTVLAPESLHLHIQEAHPEVILPNGETVDEAIARLDAERAGDPWRAGWNAAIRWLSREPMSETR